VSFDTIALHLPIAPVPASRPRVSKWGTYYGKTYSSWRKEAAKVIDGLLENDPLEGGLEVSLWFFCKKPKTTRREEPRGDVDNYIKAILDSCNGKVWVDDDQILRLNAQKRWADERGPRIELVISPA
tara:strand:- start:115 stop:495 length:381 start_codon:yes stop_codon:yes gene_type:complete